MFLRFPASWSPTTVAVVAMVVLAGLDLAGAYAAKEAVARRSPGFAALGVGLFVVLFWVYSSSLQYAELGPVTLGWIVVLQVGVVLLDRYHYGQAVPRGHWMGHRRHHRGAGLPAAGAGRPDDVRRRRRHPAGAATGRLRRPAPGVSHVTSAG